MSLYFYDEEEGLKNEEESISKYPYIFAGYKQNPPTLYEALEQMYKNNLNKTDTKNLIEEIINKCEKK